MQNDQSIRFTTKSQSFLFDYFLIIFIILLCRISIHHAYIEKYACSSLLLDHVLS